MRATVAVLFLGLGVVSCGPAPEHASGLGVALAFDPEPRVGATTCTVHLTDPQGAPVTGATVAIEGNMNHAGMVPVFGDAAETEPGRYEAPFEFTMGGDWFVIVSAELPGGGAVEEILDVTGVPSTASGGDAPSCCEIARR